MKPINFFITFLLVTLSFLSYAASNEIPITAERQIIGTQAFSSIYHFTSDNAVIEQAKRVLEMGSRMIKLTVHERSQVDTILNMSVQGKSFDTFFFWWRSNGEIWKNGLSETDKQAEYKATKEFAKYLLTSNAKVKRTFYLGHWEGDWYLLPGYGEQGFNPLTAQDPNPKRIQGMIDWLNIRQKAIDDARNEVGSNTLSKIYHYAEVNRVHDAMDNNKKRVVNSVLPYTNVDYVSYSSYDYDVLGNPQEMTNNTINYISSKLHNKSDISGPRVFIGECAINAQSVDYNPKKHEEANRALIIKFLKSGVPYVLYWQMYNNEIYNNKQRGYWLINDKNEKQPLYTTLENLYQAQDKFTDIRQQTIEWLEKRK